MPKFAMSDGRAFTDYNPSCSYNKFIQDKYNLGNSHDYRYFLQRNADQVMKDLAECNKKMACKVCPICKLSLEYVPKGN